MSQATLAALALLVLLVPAVDLGWHGSTVAQRDGVRCPIHANPVAAIPAVSPLVARVTELSAGSGEVLHLPLLDFSVFIPPRS